MFDAFELTRQQLREQGLAEADLPFAFYQPDFRTGILLLHGSAATPCNLRALGQQLFGEGYTVLAPILAGHESPARLHSGEVSWIDCYREAESALEALREQVERVFVIGSSFGGSLAYVLGAERPELLAGVIALSAPCQSSERWHPKQPWAQQVRAAIVAADEHLSHLRLPTLVMHGYDDPSVIVGNAFYAYEQIPALRKKLQIYNGIGHSLGFGFNTAEVAADIQLFIQATLPARQLQFNLPDSGQTSVALAGEFNGWQGHTLPFERRDGRWRLELELLPGVYQYKLVIDAQHWILDPEADTVPTPHGELNSILRV